MKPPIFLFILPWIAFAQTQVTVPTSGQCQAICLQEFSTPQDYQSLTGDLFKDTDVTNNTDFSLCKLGCHSPDFNELVLPAFKRGQIAYHNVIEKSTDAPLEASPISSVSLLCADVHSNSTASIRILLEYRNRSVATGPIVHYVEGVKRNHESLETVLFNFWSYSTLLDVQVLLQDPESSLQFRVTSFGPEGVAGVSAHSEWISEKQLRNAGNEQLTVKGDKFLWKEDSAAVKLSIRTSDSSLPACSLSLNYQTHSGHEQVVQFIMDRSRGFLLDRLTFDHVYSISIIPTHKHPILLSGLASSNHENLKAPKLPQPALTVRTPACLDLVEDANMCAPPSVQSIDWKWNATATDGNRVVLSWVYGSSVVDYDVKKDAAFPRMVHFDVAVHPQKTEGQPQCAQLDAQRRVVTWTHRSVVLYIPDARCVYEAEIIVVDSRNRKSRSRKSIITQEDTKSVLALTAGANIQVLLLVGFLASITLAAVGMLICRVRDRNEFNTLKKEHRQLTKSIVIAQASASSLPRSQCLTVLGDRPISSDDSQISDLPPFRSTPSQIVHCYADEGVYDSLDTPTRSEISYMDRFSGSSFHRASVIYSGPIVQGITCIPHDRFHTTVCTRHLSKSWNSANVIDRYDSASYCMKYTAEDVTALRNELRIVSSISTNHQNLMHFQALAVKENQVIGLLFEPVRGASFSGFLSDVRSRLSDRNHYTPSPASSGYDGSNSSQHSLDRYQQQIDNLTSTIYSFAAQIAGAMNFLHRQQCAHGCISSDTVYLLKSVKDPLQQPCDQMIKLGEFDHSVTQDGEVGNRCPVEITPPEVLNGKMHTNGGDIWQFGLLLSEIVCFSPSVQLWIDCNGNITDKTVKNFYSRLSTGLESANKIDPGLVQLKQKIVKCLVLDPRRRSSAAELEADLKCIQPLSTYQYPMESVEV